MTSQNETKTKNIQKIQSMLPQKDIAPVWLVCSVSIDQNQIKEKNQSLNSNLCYNRQAGVHYSRLANIKNEVWILDYVDPESQRHTEK